MKASELRIGNWVKINDDYFEDGKEIGYDLYKTNEFQIMGFNDGSFIEGCKVICFYEIPSKIGGLVHGGCRDLDIDPISLTEEWLLKFGFEKLDKTHFVIMQNDSFSSPFTITLDDNEIFKLDFQGFWYQLEFLHQLQNLYFALTNEELKIKD
jgi:hypothetical protein